MTTQSAKTEYNGKTVYYLYNEKGQRIYKRVVENGTNTDTQYVYNGDLLVTQLNPNKATDRLDFAYDENGQLFAMIVNFASTYFYVKDSLGNILGLVDEGGYLYGKYDCTAFGKCTINLDNRGVATRNPFRFKGYYYDTESEMYYCQGRYYVPEWGRWLNASDISELEVENPNGLNLFAFGHNSFVAEPSVSSYNIAQRDEHRRVELPPLPKLVTKIPGTLSFIDSLKSGMPLANLYRGFGRDMRYYFKLNSISAAKSTSSLANLKYGISKMDALFMFADVALDIYDSVQRGYRPEQVALGAGLTLVSSVALFYAEKGFIWLSTYIGTKICPGWGTAIGLGVGVILAGVMEYFGNKYSNKAIDMACEAI